MLTKDAQDRVYAGAIGHPSFAYRRRGPAARTDERFIINEQMRGVEHVRVMTNGKSSTELAMHHNAAAYLVGHRRCVQQIRCCVVPTRNDVNQPHLDGSTADWGSTLVHGL